MSSVGEIQSIEQMSSNKRAEGLWWPVSTLAMWLEEYRSLRLRSVRLIPRYLLRARILTPSGISLSSGMEGILSLLAIVSSLDDGVVLFASSVCRSCGSATASSNGG
ncbi:MAG: hypothetical protein M1582_02770 [Actinobacteria bacterium]|nr:hypothetical protein [Actinomycetota bacterium]